MKEENKNFNRKFVVENIFQKQNTRVFTYLPAHVCNNNYVDQLIVVERTLTNNMLCELSL